ncbi:MAG: phasin family protein [Cyanophyceae cyanobacterium]
MAGFKDIVQKAFYLGVGLADYAAEKAGTTIQELRVQSQKLADEMVARGEMTTDEARRFVDDLVKQAEQQSVQPPDPSTATPRRIEIVSEDEELHQKAEDVDHLRQQVQSLQEELRRIKRH